MPKRRATLHRANTVNRFAAVLCHIPAYNGRYLSKLSADTGIAKYTLRRIIGGEVEPHPLHVLSLWKAICREMKRPLPLSELIVPKGKRFRTRYPCELFNCHCYPPWARDESDRLKSEYSAISPGTWTYQVSTDLPNSNR